MGNQSMCCNYKQKDQHGQNLDPQDEKMKCEKQNQRLLNDLVAKAKPHESKIIKIQAHVKGYLYRKDVNNPVVVRGAMDNMLNEPQAQQSNRSANQVVSCGKNIMLDKGKPILVNGNQMPQELDELPDYGNDATRATELELGPFVYDDNPETPRQGVELISKGPCVLDNGALYHGQWTTNGMRQGRGIQLWRDGSKYEGHWLNDQAHGKGRLIHSDGDYYQGEWKQDMANGKGTFQHVDGAIYAGEWQQDKYHGYGVETWPDNDRYEGKYENGLKQGIGTFNWTDGSSYIGEFTNNNIHGKGVYTWPDGRKYEGEWRGNKMNGKGTFIWPDGRKYVGEYHEDKKKGYGQFDWPDGRCYRGEWLNGRQHGKGAFVTSAGVERYGEWSHGKRVRWIGENDI